MHDVLVIGGGPGGSAAAWQAATHGLSVLVCDRAAFPRDKPCGDGLTPRAVKLIGEMGLADALDRFHRVDRFRLVGGTREVEGRWPAREGLPDHGYVVPRTELDQLLVQRAEKVGAEVWQNAEGRTPIVEDGLVRGVVVRRGDRDVEVAARITIAADGMSSRVGRSLGMRPQPSAPFAIAVRAQAECRRPDDSVLEVHFTLRHGKRLLPGYGWVFPMGNGLVNVGVGYLSTYRHWKSLNINAVMAQFLDTLPREWALPSVERLLSDGRMSGWRLPIGLSVWPPTRPGLMAVGDAAAAIKPWTGVGISKAVHTGMLAGRTAVTALGSPDPSDVSAYADELQRQWGAFYRVGRGFTRLVGHPAVMGAWVGSAMKVAGLADFFTTLMTGNGEFDQSSLQHRALRRALRVVERLPSRPARRGGT